MRILQIISPARLMRFVGGEHPAGRALSGLNDHYLHDIGLRRERPGARHDPWAT